MLRMYRDLGLSVIPVQGKRAVVSDWSRWCHELPPMELVEQWAKQFPLPYYGIALCAGPASNIDALDIDSDSEDILTMCPRSPLSRFGARGAMPLFQHNPKLVKRKRDRDNLTPNEIKKDKEGVQLLTTGNYLVLPPSIHPDTNRPYKWLTEYNLENFSVHDLAQLTQDDIDEVIVYISRFPLTNADGSIAMGGVGGRNDKLTLVCYAMIKNQPWMRDDDLAVELLAFDERRHSPPYFSDPKEMYYRKAATPFGRALLFVRGSIERIEKKMKRISI